jgi:hypothetical protein
MCDASHSTCLCRAGHTGGNCEWVDCREWLVALGQDTMQSNSECCAGADCTTVPTKCSSGCADLWIPFVKSCSHYIDGDSSAHQMYGDSLHSFVESCEATRYGGSPSARCTIPAYSSGLQEISVVCGTDFSATCTSDCAPQFEDYFIKCKLMIRQVGMLPVMEPFYFKCQEAQKQPSDH